MTILTGGLFMAVSEENTRTLITISKEKKIRLEQIAKDEKRSFSNLIDIITDDFLNEYDKKKNTN